METSKNQLTAYIQELSNKVIESYHDEEFQIEIDFSGAIQMKGIRFKQSFSPEQLETILPIVYERGAIQAGKRLGLLLQNYQPT